jgi:hypothetical protein
LSHEGVAGPLLSQGQSGSIPETHRWRNKCNDMAVDLRDVACSFVASLGFLFSLGGYSAEAITDEARRLGSGGGQVAHGAL